MEEEFVCGASRHVRCWDLSQRPPARGVSFPPSEGWEVYVFPLRGAVVRGAPTFGQITPDTAYAARDRQLIELVMKVVDTIRVDLARMPRGQFDTQQYPVQMWIETVGATDLDQGQAADDDDDDGMDVGGDDDDDDDDDGGGEALSSRRRRRRRARLDFGEASVDGEDGNSDDDADTNDNGHDGFMSSFVRGVHTRVVEVRLWLAVGGAVPRFAERISETISQNTMFRHNNHSRTTERAVRTVTEPGCVTAGLEHRVYHQWQMVASLTDWAYLCDNYSRRQRLSFAPALSQAVARAIEFHDPEHPLHPSKAFGINAYFEQLRELTDIIDVMDSLQSDQQSYVSANGTTCTTLTFPRPDAVVCVAVEREGDIATLRERFFPHYQAVTLLGAPSNVTADDEDSHHLPMLTALTHGDPSAGERAASDFAMQRRVTSMVHEIADDWRKRHKDLLARGGSALTSFRDRQFRRYMQSCTGPNARVPPTYQLVNRAYHSTVFRQRRATERATERDAHCLQLLDPTLSVFGNWVAQRMAAFEMGLLMYTSHDLTMLLQLSSLDAFRITEHGDEGGRSVTVIWGPPELSKSYGATAVNKMSIPGTVLEVTYQTAKAMMTQSASEGRTHIHHEMPGSLMNDGTRKGAGATSADHAQASNLWKDTVSSGRVLVQEFDKDPETRKRTVRVTTSDYQVSDIFCTNNKPTDMCDAVRSRSWMVHAQRHERTDVTMEQLMSDEVTSSAATSDAFAALAARFQREQMVVMHTYGLIACGGLPKITLCALPRMQERFKRRFSYLMSRQRVHEDDSRRLWRRIAHLVQVCVIINAYYSMYALPDSPVHGKPLRLNHLRYIAPFLHDTEEIVLFCMQMAAQEIGEPQVSPVMQSLYSTFFTDDSNRVVFKDNYLPLTLRASFGATLERHAKQLDVANRGRLGLQELASSSSPATSAYDPHTSSGDEGDDYDDYLDDDGLRRRATGAASLNRPARPTEVTDQRGGSAFKKRTQLVRGSSRVHPPRTQLNVAEGSDDSTNGSDCTVQKGAPQQSVMVRVAMGGVNTPETAAAREARERGGPEYSLHWIGREILGPSVRLAVENHDAINGTMFNSARAPTAPTPAGRQPMRPIGVAAALATGNWTIDTNYFVIEMTMDDLCTLVATDAMPAAMVRDVLVALTRTSLMALNTVIVGWDYTANDVAVTEQTHSTRTGQLLRHSPMLAVRNDTQRRLVMVHRSLARPQPVHEDVVQSALTYSVSRHTPDDVRMVIGRVMDYSRYPMLMRVVRAGDAVRGPEYTIERRTMSRTVTSMWTGFMREDSMPEADVDESRVVNMSLTRLSAIMCCRSVLGLVEADAVVPEELVDMADSNCVRQRIVTHMDPSVVSTRALSYPRQMKAECDRRIRHAERLAEEDMHGDDEPPTRAAARAAPRKTTRRLAGSSTWLGVAATTSVRSVTGVARAYLRKRKRTEDQAAYNAVFNEVNNC